jgi:hypothetical protein
MTDENDEKLTDAEMQRRLERALKRSVTTPPKPITKKDSGKPALKGRKARQKGDTSKD